LNPNLGIRIRQLDARLDTRTVKVECSSATIARKEHIGEDFSKPDLGGVQLPPEGKAKEHDPRGETGRVYNDSPRKTSLRRAIAPLGITTINTKALVKGVAILGSWFLVVFPVVAFLYYLIEKRQIILSPVFFFAFLSGILAVRAAHKLGKQRWN
jgi:hypothetical protein